MEENNNVQEINFNGNKYVIEDLTPRAIEGFNTLFKAQQKLSDLTMEVKIVQGGHNHISAELQKILEEDKIKPKTEIEVPKKK